MQIQIRHQNLELTQELTKHVERQLGFALGRFNGRVRLAVVRLADLNGPKGGVDRECRMEIKTSWSALIHITERDADIFAAVSRAADRAGRAFDRQSKLRHGTMRLRRTSIAFGD